MAIRGGTWPIGGGGTDAMLGGGGTDAMLGGGIEVEMFGGKIRGTCGV